MTDKEFKKVKELFKIAELSNELLVKQQFIEMIYDYIDCAVCPILEKCDFEESNETNTTFQQLLYAWLISDES